MDDEPWSNRNMHAALSALTAAGYAVVPVQMTEEMIGAGAYQANKYITGMKTDAVQCGCAMAVFEAATDIGRIDKEPT